MNTFYHLLGVHAGATQDELNDARRKLARRHHPDFGGDHDTMARINLAHHTLENDELHKLYRADLKTKMRLVDCPVCAGAGFTWVQRGFKSRTKVACAGCSGVGMVYNVQTRK